MEKKSLIIGAIVNSIMAFAGLLAYYLSNSEALLLDGVFSFISFASLLMAIKISSIKSNKNELYPFGQYVYESLYSLLKGVMISGVLILAFASNVTKIISYINGEKIAILSTDVILIYSTFMAILCFGLAWYYNYQNKKVNNSSSMLSAEQSASTIDGFLSIAIGMVLVAISFFDIDGNFGFLYYIGDAIIVIILVVLLGKDPYNLILNSFIEMTGGTLQNKIEKKNIEYILEKYLSSDNSTIKNYISKTGSSYLVIAYIDAESFNRIGFEKIANLKLKIMKNL